MPSINSYGYTTTRLTGLTSSLDTDAIIENLMRTHQVKVDREFRAQTRMEWKQESYNTVANDLKEFRQTYMSVLSDKNVLSEGTFKRFDVSTTDEKGYVSITANAQASAGSVTIQHIEQLATATHVTSSSKVSNGGQLSENNNTKLGYLSFAKSPNFQGGVVSFRINGETFSFDEETSLGEMISAVNGSDAGVTLSYSRLTDKFTLSSKEMGASLGSGDTARKVTFADITGNMLGAMGLSEVNVEGGQNARMVVEGELVERSSNNFDIDGVQYTLKRAHGRLEKDQNGNFILNEDNAITATITQNFDNTVEKIKEFVSGYNTMIAKLNTMLTEKADKDYFPLTEEEQEQLTEEQYKKWESLAKQGNMRNDAGVQALVDSIRSAFFESVGDSGITPAELGFSTGNWREYGKITLDEPTLRAALEKDSDAVMRVFTNSSESEDPVVERKESGLLYRMTNAIDLYTKNNNDKLSQLTTSITNQKKKIADMEDRMKDLEEQYYLKYSAMETALAELQSQTNWISQMFAEKDS